MQKDEILFQVMVPIYKVEPYLDECIQSVLNQTYRNFHLILVDDGSPDRCGEICDAYAAKDARITVYHKPNGGLMQTRRFAIQNAGKAGYSIFLDGDDSLRPEALQTIAEKIEKYCCDCVIFGAEHILNGTPVRRVDTLAERDILIHDKRELLNIVLNRGFNALWRKAVKMEYLFTWDFSPFFHISIGEDRLQSLEIYENAKSFCFIDEVLYNYRVNPSSMSRTRTYENYKVDFSVQEAELALLKRVGVFTDADYALYRSNRLCDLSMEAVFIATMKTSRKNRIRLFEEIKATAYWKTFLSLGTPQQMENWKLAVIFDAFKRGAYSEIFVLSSTYGMLNRLLGRDIKK